MQLPFLFAVILPDLLTSATEVSLLINLSFAAQPLPMSFLCFFSSRWRISIAIITAFIAGAYYVIMAYYALRIADEQYATITLSIMAVLPAVVCQMMLLTRRNILQSNLDKADFALDNDTEDD